MTIQERLKCQYNEDIIMIAELLESEGAIVVAEIIHNFMNMELSNSRSDSASSDRKIGRLEAYRTILDDIESFKQRRDELNMPVMEDGEDTSSAQEQVTVPRHSGEI